MEHKRQHENEKRFVYKKDVFFRSLQSKWRSSLIISLVFYFSFDWLGEGKGRLIIQQDRGMRNQN